LIIPIDCAAESDPAVVLYQNVHGAGRDVNIPTDNVDRALGDLIIRGFALMGVTYFDILGDGMDACPVRDTTFLSTATPMCSPLKLGSNSSSSTMSCRS
jgi:hypothetical protein